MYIYDLNKERRDYRYFKENGWFESDYYYKVRLGIVKKIFGKIIDNLGKRLRLKRNRDLMVNNPE